MKQYKGKLSLQTNKLIEQYKDRLSYLIDTKNRLSGLTGRLGRTTSSNVYTIEESIAKYNSGISLDEIKAWVWYRRKQGIPMLSWSKYHTKPSETELNKWVNSGVLFYDAANGGNLVPFPIFAFGNIYEKIGKTKKDQETIVSNFGNSVYENHLKVLEDLKPKPLSISNPVVAERPVVLAISEFADTFMVSSVKDLNLTEPATLKEAYKDWLRALEPEAFKKTRALEVINYYLNNEQKPRNIDKIEWNEIKKITRDEGERLFKVFLHEALEYQDQLKIDADYNSRFNAVAPLQVNKIPIALEISKKFMGLELDIRPAQREGIAFMELTGSGIIAYDVGVGKTITAIIELVNALKTGKCKRPVVAVPNPTYKNWIKEMIGVDGKEGILTGTGIELNLWYNLGVDVDAKIDRQVKENTITLVTFEGLEKIGFGQDAIDDHFNELSNILSQTDEKSERDKEKDNEKLREIIGVGNKETITDIETLGFDYICVDEAHNFKNVFSEVKSDEKHGKQFYVKGGEPSNRGIKLFFLCNYIQRTYKKNVMLLTATPFTNSPLEIYSMLSFVAFDYMKSWGIYNLRSFFEQYIQETTEYVVGIDGEIQQRNVVKSFNNRISLQKLINSHINFKTGEEANIPRPCKINLPKTTILTDTGVQKLSADKQVLTYLKMNDRQHWNQIAINEEAKQGADRDDPGKLLRLMSMSLNNALSPFLYSGQPKDYIDFVENSPKIKYTVDCIRTVKQWHEKRNEPVSGQLIYMDRGKDYFHYIKTYLEKELGYKTGVTLKDNPRLKCDEVEIITSGISQANKEKIKVAFNEGTCKIIIGTSTIREGINLQEKSTVGYNLYPNWNPTDIRQWEGRFWRQKNMFGYVRSVMPLVENSMDIFVFQKLEEKTSRINDLWSKSDRGNVLDEASLDPNEVKFALVTDLGVLARLEMKQITAELNSKVTVLKSNIEDLSNYVYLKNQIENYRVQYYNYIITRKDGFKQLPLFYLDSGDRFYFDDISRLDKKGLEQLSKEKQTIITRYQELYEMLVAASNNHTDKDLIQCASRYNTIVFKNNSDYNLNQFKETVSRYAKIKKTIFEQRGFSEGTDLSIVRDDLDKELLLTGAELEELGTAEFEDKLMDKIKLQKERYAVKGGSLEDRVNDFASLNYIMSYRFEDIDHHSCSIPTVENKVVRTSTDDKERRLKIAKAKAIAIRIKLKLVA